MTERCGLLPLRTLAVVVLVSLVTSSVNAQLRVSSTINAFADADGTIGLSQRTPLGVAPDQSIVLVDVPRDGLYRLSETLTNLRRVGRKGSGPGEYLNITSFGWLSDTLWASDDRTARITFVANLGRGKARTQSVIGAATANGFTTQPIALTRDGMAISGLTINTIRGITVAIPPEPLLRLPRGAAARWDTLFLLDVRNRSQEIRVQKASFVAPQLMSDGTLWALSRNGEFAVKVDRSDEASQRQEAPVLTLMGTDGRVIYKAGLPHPKERVTRSDVDTLVARKVAGFNAAAKAEWVPRLTVSLYKQGLFVPHYRISVVDVVLGDDGTVLLRGNDWTSAEVTYTWFTPNGTVRGAFSVPPTQFVRAVSGKSIWSIIEDRDGETRLIKQSVN